MTIIGFILLAVGGVISLLILTERTPEAVATLPFPEWVWFIVTVVGALLMYFNRRPSN